MQNIDDKLKKINQEIKAGVNNLIDFDHFLSC